MRPGPSCPRLSRDLASRRGEEGFGAGTQGSLLRTSFGPLLGTPDEAAAAEGSQGHGPDGLGLVPALPQTGPGTWEHLGTLLNIPDLWSQGALLLAAG